MAKLKFCSFFRCRFGKFLNPILRCTEVWTAEPPKPPTQTFQNFPKFLHSLQSEISQTPTLIVNDWWKITAAGNSVPREVAGAHVYSKIFKYLLIDVVTVMLNHHNLPPNQQQTCDHVPKLHPYRSSYQHLDLMSLSAPDTVPTFPACGQLTWGSVPHPGFMLDFLYIPLTCLPHL